ncbi:MAG: PAS domain S-box protein [bacterium]|nr:PAS domain S-box protein [bacterium]
MPAHDNFCHEFVQHLDLAMLVISDGLCVDCNDAAVRLFGCADRAALLQTHPAALSPPLQADGVESKSKADAYLHRAHAEGSVRFEWLHQRADGRVFPAEVLLTSLATNGTVHVIALVQDISARVSAVQTIAAQLQRAHTIATIAARFAGTMACDEALHATVADIGRFAAVERVNLFRFNAAHTLLTNTHQWAADATENLHAQLQSIPVAPFHWGYQQLLEQGLVCVNDVHALPPAAAAEKAIWLHHGVGAVVMVALAGAGSMHGYICLDCDRRAHVWRDEEIAFLRTCADIIAAAVLRHEAEQALHLQQTNLATLVADRTRQLSASNAQLQAEIAERAKAEQAYAKHSHILTIMTDQLADMVYYKDHLFRYLFSSAPHCRRILKCTPAECIGKTDVELAVQARARGHRQGFGEVCFNSDVATRTAAQPCQFIEEATLDGEHLTLEVHKTPLFNEHGRFTGIVGSTRDVTQRKRVERAIRESEARYRTIFEQSPIALWELNAAALKACLTELGHAGITNLREYFERNPEKLQDCVTKMNVVDVNHAGLALMGAGAREQLMKQLGQTFAPATWPVFLALCVAIAHNEPLFESEMPVRTLDGRDRMCLARWVVAKGYSESYAKMFVTLMDITGQARAQQALAESELRHRLMFENSPVALVETDSSDAITYLSHLRSLGVEDFGAFFDEHPEEVRECMRRVRLVDANYAAVRILRADSRAQVLAQLSKTFVEQSLRDFARQLVAMARGDQIFECESVVQCFDGTLIHVALRIAVMPGHEATHACVIDSFTDITELKQLRAQCAQV